MSQGTTASSNQDDDVTLCSDSNEDDDDDEFLSSRGKVIPEWNYILTLDERFNKTVREEFSYDHVSCTSVSFINYLTY